MAVAEAAEEAVEGVVVVDKWVDEADEEVEDSVKNKSKVVVIIMMVDTLTIGDIATIIITWK